jgi:asparagine synthase (glutamine-hydrolysing)
VRLSIIDLSQAGHQPMFSNDEKYCLIFNGEIYNYLELRNELKDSYSFHTQTDSEVLLAAYIKWGSDCLDKLNGDFAFVILNRESGDLFGARDRFGIKPFYYYADNKTVMFASEIKALLPFIPSVEANKKIIFDYLVYNRTDHTPETFFRNIFRLPHGHCFTISDGEFSIRRWYNLPDKINYPNPLTPEEYREEIRKSVRLRLRSDVPLGVSLSGGIDSSAITSIIISDFGVNDLQTFSAVYGNGIWADESRYINEYRNQAGVMNFITPDADTFWSDFRNFIHANGEPVAIGAYAQYKVMELAHGKVVVTLDGQGVDEMLGGYHYFFGGYFKELLSTLRLLSLTREISCYVAKHRSSHALKYLGFYMLPASQQKKMGSKLYGSLGREFFDRFSNDSSLHKDLYNPATLNKSFLQHFEHKLEHLLKWGDHNSLRFSIESRVPFLDHNLVEKTLSLPSRQVIRNGRTKYLLLESVRDILPRPIYSRYDKKGFTTPSDIWFRSPMFREYIPDLLNSESFRNRGIFNVDDALRKYSEHLSGKSNSLRDLWKWINLEEWFREYIDKKQTSS